MRTTSARGAKAKADKLFSAIVRSHGFCQACGKTRILQTAHVFSRRFANTRTDLRNAFCLCAGCHMRFTNRPTEWAAWVHEHMDDFTYRDLLERSQLTTKVNWHAEVVRLQAIYEECAA